MLLEEAGLSAADVARAPSNVVASVVVGEVRSLKLGVWNDPWPPGEPPHPRDVAHTLIKGLELLGKKESLRVRRALAALPSMAFVYPPGYPGAPTPAST